MGLVTTFRHRHPNFERYTYARNNTTVALDDIYISARTAHKMGASGIWLHTIHSSDNAGTPYMAIDLFPGDHTPYRLTGVQPIRAVTRNLAKVEINSFGAHTSKLLLEGQLPQLTPAPPTKAATTWSPQEIVDWLDEAVRNLYDILYTSAKLKWGETSQTRKALNRAVEIQRNNQCTAHLRQLFRLHEANLHTGTEFTRLAHLVEWPKWIRNPNVLPPRAGTALEPLLLANGGLQCLPNRTLPTTGTSGPDMDSHAGPTSVANNAPPAPDTGLEANRQQVPQLVRDWLLHDVDRPDEVTHAFQTPEGTTWDTYHYDEDIQARCERSLRTRVSPEHGGVHMNSGSQGAQNRTISSLLFVDDTLDISTSYAGIQDRAGISNYFTGQSASGSVFGADKSFLFYLSPRAHPDIALNDGLGIPQPICVIAPSKGFAT
ncbi:hypothetical protein B5M09_009693 [Aphanomyces astaci]|uniref:Uncharacterized protein n=1 Tax=Aphanomyces astaci TaxID=112090 RepID=A0A425DFW5_APHAT|nr:hypothetical protein B5M09_009693 [Aphanomyces astaci]